MKILILNGANLNLLGKREPHIYGTKTLSDLEHLINSNFPNIHFEFFQSNLEGDLINKLQQFKGDGVVFNPGAFCHTSIALHDTIKSIDTPVVEVHISNIHAREEMRRHSITASASVGIISGFHFESYLLGISYLNQKNQQDKT